MTTANQLIEKINSSEEELVILFLNLPEIHKDFQIEGVVPLTDNWQIVATTQSVVNKINPAENRKSGWFDILEKYVPEDQWNLSADDQDYPVTWYPVVPFDCWYMTDKTDKDFYQQATLKALEILKGLDPDKVPECYLDLVT